ncbi:MAG: nuclear transport factor 2 family protein [Actinomycetota bacterium]|nr:nuclear transport factor 2 family protein [Actinomycetota bacterium]
MSQADIEALLGGYEAFNRGDTAAWLDRFDQDAELHDLPNAPDTRVYRGHDGLREWAELVGGEAWAEFRFEPEEVREAGEFVFVSVRITARGRGSGVPTDMRVFHVAEIRGGKVVRLAGYFDRAEALEAAGLTE